MAHTQSTQRFYTGNPQPRKPFLYSLYEISPFTIQYIYNVFRYSIYTKTLIPKTGIIFSKPLKIEKSAKNRKNHPQKNLLLQGIVRHSCRIGCAHTHTCKEYNTYPTFSHLLFYLHPGVPILYSQQSRVEMPIDPLHQEKFSVLTYFLNESATFFKV